MVVLAVCGTPGSGKTTLITRVCKRDPSIRVINVADLVRSERLYSEYDDALDAAVMDTKRVKKRLAQLLQSSATTTKYLVETHTPSVLPSRLITRCLVLQCATSAIYDRLTDRGYSNKKRAENVEAEIMQVVWEEAVECFGEGRVRVRKSDGVEDAKENARYIRRWFRRHQE
jgi:adenylate kinase